MTKKYDSTQDTAAHVSRVTELLAEAIRRIQVLKYTDAGAPYADDIDKVSIILTARGKVHDASKFLPPEKELFDEYTPKLKGCTYGSEEYNKYLKGLNVALVHHYAHNRHHPEHHAGGIGGMNLFDIIEMFFDWKAATERHADGDIFKSLVINKKRFAMSDQLTEILTSTAHYMWSEKYDSASVNIFDIIPLFFLWKSRADRREQSLIFRGGSFVMSEQLTEVFINTNEAV